MPSWIGSRKMPCYQSVTSCITQGICKQKMTAIVPTRISGTSIFYTQHAVEENGQGIYCYPLYIILFSWIHPFKWWPSKKLVSAKWKPERLWKTKLYHWVSSLCMTPLNVLRHQCHAALMKTENKIRYCFKGLLYIVEKDYILLLLYKCKLTKLVSLFI